MSFAEIVQGAGKSLGQHSADEIEIDTEERSFADDPGDDIGRNDPFFMVMRTTR
jgi:hypothetical protein